MGCHVPQVTTVKKAAKPQGECEKCGAAIKKGDAYRWWKFRFSAKHVVCMAPDCTPKANDLTQSEYTMRCNDFSDELAALLTNYRDPEGLPDMEGLASELESFAESVREFGEEQQSKLDNMPDSLQQSETGQLLEERAGNMEQAADTLDEAASNARDAELIDVTDPAALKAWGDSEDCPEDRKAYSTDEDYMQAVKEAAEQVNSDALTTVLDEAEGVSFE